MTWATMKAFLLVFPPEIMPRQAILNFLDTRSEVLNWLAIFSGAILVVSEQDVRQLSELFRQGFPGIEFFLTEVLYQKNDGWQNSAVWDFVNNPKSSGRWK